MLNGSRSVGAALAVMMCCLSLQAKTLPEIRAAAEKGDADAQFELGFYCVAVLCGKEKAAAEKWFRKAAEQGHVAARAMCFSEGYGVERDIAKAVELASQAAETGDAWSQLCLGIHYAASDSKQSLHWFRKAAERGNGWAQVCLGMAYLGIISGVPENPEQGADWVKKAAEQGNAMGQMLLGRCHAKGVGVPQDREKAVYWLRKAAEQGLEPAEAALKRMGE